MLARSITHGCPHCGAPASNLERVPRRTIDRLISVVRLQHRYRCRSASCDWVGNFSAKHLAASDLPRTQRHYW
jgi:hypothetical protein